MKPFKQLIRGWKVILPPLVLFSLSHSAVATVSATGVMLSPGTVNFGYQLVGATSNQITKTLTNSSTQPLVIKDIDIISSDRDDFTETHSFGLPLTLAPGSSVAINLFFTPHPPWKPGTRDAKLKIQHTGGVEFVDLTGMGVNCGGPIPAALSHGICADTDLDGLNDVWEDNDYIDLNNNGKYDAGVDFAFPHRTPFLFSSVTKTGSGSGRMFPTVTDPGVEVSPSTVVVTVATSGAVGAATFTYSVHGEDRGSSHEEGSGSDDASTGGPLEIRPVVNIGGNLRLLFYRSSATEGFVAGDTFSFTMAMGEEAKVVDKNVPNIFVQYDYMDYDVPGNACVADPDCDQRGLQLNDVCHGGFCTHNHYPSDPLFRKVVDQFAVHGITLYIHPSPKAIPHAGVVTWAKYGDIGNGPHTTCAGDEVPAVGITGSQAINFHNIKNRPGSDFALDPLRKNVYHYTVFAHANTCLNGTPGAPGDCGTCPQDRSTPAGFPLPAATGTAELPGNDFIISLGPMLNNPIASAANNPFIEEGVFMHELGHNLGLHHAGDVAAPEKAPNYLSVMNYKYTSSGIQHAATPGSNVPVEDLRELDYSEHTLNTLVESSLDENAGTSPRSSGYTGIVHFFNAAGANAVGAEAGPIDWDGINGIDANPVVVDINKLNGATETMVGYRDWDHTAGQSGSGGGACTTSADCRINAIRNLVHIDDPAIDPHEPCVNGRCQSLWLNFQNTPWGKADGPPALRHVFEPGPSMPLPATKVNLFLEKARLRGTPEAPVTVVEYSDFQCPYCKRAASVVSQVRQSYGNKVNVIFKQMPLAFHQHAFKAAQASFCAAQQGKFWEVHDRLFSSGDLSVAALTQIASEVGLNVEDFTACLESETSRSGVMRDIEEARRLGVTGTPTFFINGKKVVGAISFDELKQEIEQAGLDPDARIKTASVQDDARNLALGHLSHEVAKSPSQEVVAVQEQAQQAAAKPNENGVSLSPAALNFGYQLVGATSNQFEETITNSGTAWLTVSDIDVIGRDHKDFATSFGFSLPVKVAPGNSIAINLVFTATGPWRAGTRDAELKIQHSRGVEFLELTGIGATCGGPLPACSSGCPDADGDGLNDAWEIAGGIDLNNDGKIDAEYDLILAGADPNKQDIYVQYDWMDWGLPGNACNVNADCGEIASGHAGETCTGPQVLPTSAGSCRYACTADADCAGRGSGHLTERCAANSCVHTHDPDILAPGALQAVVDSFAAHGINLHLIRGHALPHSLVTSFRRDSGIISGQDNSINSACEGAGPGGGVGVGKYAVSLYDLKSISSLDPLKIAYHYALFSHYSGCDTADHCRQCPVATNPDGSPKNFPVFGESGLAEISGNDFIVSLGARFSDLRHEPGIFDFGSTFMHELGHNLGLHHGGGIDTPCQMEGAACPDGGVCTTTPVGKLCLQGDENNAKPNYLSVMNYRYQFTGIQSGSAVGSVLPISNRLDYSTQILPRGGNTPGYLDQSIVPDQPAVGDPGLGLNEAAGLGSGTADIFTFTNGKETGIPHVAATDGLVDWSGNGDFQELHVQADTNCGPPGFGDHLCTALRYQKLAGHSDWGPGGQNNFNYKFQCTPFGGPNGDGASSPQRFLQHEMSTEMAMQAHVALPIRPVEINITPGSSEKLISPGTAGQFSVALLGSDDLDVAEVEQSSLRFEGATPMRVEMRDVNGDGKLDLVVFFDQGTVRLHPLAKKARLTGWLKSSQAFIGEDHVTIPSR